MRLLRLLEGGGGFVDHILEPAYVSVISSIELLSLFSMVFFFLHSIYIYPR